MGKWPVAFWRDGGGMEPRRSYGPRNGLGARLSTAPPRLQPPRSWLIVAVVVLAEVALITSAYVFANLAFPH